MPHHQATRKRWQGETRRAARTCRRYCNRAAACGALIFVFAASAVAQESAPLERFQVAGDEGTVTLEARVVVEAADGGLLVEGRDGTYHQLITRGSTNRETLDEAFTPLDSDHLGEALLKELPPGFEIHQTKHYVIAFNTSEAYARWVGSLFERLQTVFPNYWRRLNIRLEEPENPLVVLAFADRAAYAAYAAEELGENADRVVGYYSLLTNRVAMYDLTGVQAGETAGRRGSRSEILAMLSEPRAAENVATVVHEATHQIAYNAGLHRRLADIPLWVAEGVAMYFETPDPDSRRGWGRIDGRNERRYARFQRYLPSRRPGAIRDLIADDDRLRNGADAINAYAEAWALNYFLLKTAPKQYGAYLELLAAKKPLLWDDPEERVAEFESTFGASIDQIDAAFVRYMTNLR